MKSILSSLLFLFISFNVIPQSNGDIYIKSLREKFNAIIDLTADVTQTVNGKSSFSARISFKKENNLRIDSQNSLIVSNGKFSWNYNKKENKVIITDYEADNSLFSINFLVYQFPDQCTLSGEREGNFRKLTLIPRSKVSNFGEVILWINKEDLIEKIQTSDPSTGLIVLNFRNININQNLPASDFQFTPPQGSKVIDLR